MLAVFKNDCKRLWEEKMYLVVSLILMIAALSAAILLTTRIETRGNIALVVPDQQELSERDSALLANPYFNVTVLEKTPATSALVQSRYDAVVTTDSDQITTIKNTAFKTTLEAALADPADFVPDDSQARHTGTNILGFMMMFLLMQGVLYARFFAEDKEKHLIRRIALSPIPFWQYIMGHGVFIGIIIAVPSFLVVAAAALLRIDIGFSLPVYAGLLGILALLATAFALFLNSFFDVADTANMLGSAIIILTSILAGSFCSLSQEATLFDKLLHLLPQKDFINFITALENGSLSQSTCYQLVYVVAVAVAFLAVAVANTRRDYVCRR